MAELTHAEREAAPRSLSSALAVLGGIAYTVWHRQPEFVERIRYPLRYEAIVRGHARNYDLDPSLLAAVIYTESKFNANARSNAGAIGLMQLLPDTAQGIAVTHRRERVRRQRPLRPGAERPLRRVVPAPPARPLRRRADGARGLSRRSGKRRPVAQGGCRDPVPGNPELRRQGREGEGDLRRDVREGTRAALASPARWPTSATEHTRS